LRAGKAEIPIPLFRAIPVPLRYDAPKGPIMTWQDRITLDPAVLAGKPVIRNTRLSVDFILGLLGQDWTEADILRNYPGLTHDDIAACLRYASEVLQAERVYPLPARTA